MRGVTRPIFGVLLGTLLLAQGIVASSWADAFEGAEIVHQGGSSVVSVPIPPGVTYELSEFPAQNQLNVTFSGASVRQARRIHSDPEGALLRAVDLEPWSVDTEPRARLVVRTAPGARTFVNQEGEVLRVTVVPQSLISSARPSVRDQEALVSLDLQGADIHTVLRSLSEASGRNIVANANVAGTVRLKLTDVPWRTALDIVMRTHDLGAVEDNGIIRVAMLRDIREAAIEHETAERKREELVPLETTVIPVMYANASELLQTLEGRLTKRGNIVVDSRTNALIITDTPTNIPRISSLVLELDSRTPQVEIVAKLVDIDYSAIDELGIRWDAQNIHSSDQAISGNVGVNAALSEPIGQVNVGIIRTKADFDLAIQALASDNRANIISNPRITTVNNREARILVGKEIPLVVRDEAGNAITELKKIGIELRVTPHINQGELITLDLSPTVSDLASQASTQEGGVIINTTEADTRVMVLDGQTAVIGGLIRTNETEFHSGVPILKDIPILGNLFRSSSKADAKRELVIFVTPKILG